MEVGGVRVVLLLEVEEERGQGQGHQGQSKIRGQGLKAIVKFKGNLKLNLEQLYRVPEAEEDMTTDSLQCDAFISPRYRSRLSI